MLGTLARTFLILLAVLTSAASAVQDRGNLAYLPPRVDARAVAELTPVAKELYERQNPGIQLADVYSADEDWFIARHPDTGIILARKLTFMFGLRDPADGQCKYHLRVLVQENLGPDSWSAVALRLPHHTSGYDYDGWIAVPCSMLPQQASAVPTPQP